MKKKVLSILLAAITLVATLSGCGSNSGDTNGTDGSEAVSDSQTASAENGEYPVIKYALMCMAAPVDLQEVQDAICEITEAEIQADVELIPIELGSLADKMNLLVSGGDNAIDVFPVVIWSSLSTVVNNGQALCLDDYMDDYGAAIKGTLVEDTLICGKVDGKLYGIPRYLDLSNCPDFVLAKDIAEQLGVENGSSMTLEELTDLFRRIREIDPTTPIIASDYNTIGATADVDALGDANTLGCLLDYGQSTTVVNYYESKAYDRLVENYKIWKELNAYMPDPLNNTEAKGDYFGSGKALGLFGAHYEPTFDADYYTNNYGREAVAISIDRGPNVTDTFYYAVSTTCPYPEKAVEWLGLMASNADIENLLINGIEGKHYVVTDDGCATYADGVDAANIGWSMGMNWTQMNCAISYPFNFPGDFYDIMIASNQNAKVSKAFGFVFNNESVSNQVTACANVVSQYRHAIELGAVDDIDATVADFRQALRDAGIEEVIAEEQRQLDEWLAIQ